MTEPEPEYTPTLDGDYRFYDLRLQERKLIPKGMLAYWEQRRRAIITELRALDKMLGRRQTIPRKE